MDRDRFLERVAAEVRNGGASSDAPLPAAVTGMRTGPTDRGGMVRLFTERLAELGGTTTLVPTRPAALAAISETLRRATDASVACPPGLRWAGIADIWTDDPRCAEFGLSEADWGIADTGTVVLRHQGERGRGYSLVPPAAGFLLPVSRLVPHLGVVLATIHEEMSPLPACITFISGPSHSGDIAGVTCTGVHGPGQVHVWLVEDE